MANPEAKITTTGYPMPGDVLDERYRLDEIINAGGMGVIMRARQLTMDRDVAVKLLLPSKAERENTRIRFEREVHLAKQLTHPNTIRLYDYGRHGDFLYLVMELLTGQDLKALVRKEGPLPVGRALDILIQAADAVSEAHAHNIVHRDLKPGNIFIQRLGSNRDFVKVLDFGIAKSLDSHKFDVTSTGEVSGTVAYLSPEILRGARPDKRADVYALGVVFVEMITGRKIFEGITVAKTLVNQLQMPAMLPPTIANTAVAQVIERALAKNPDARYQDAAELLDALNSVVPTVSPTTRVSAAEVEATYGPLPDLDATNSSDAVPMDTPSPGAPPRGTQIGYALADEPPQPATVRVRTNEDLAPEPKSSPPWAMIASGLAIVALAVGLFAVLGGDAAAPDASPVAPIDAVAASPPPPTPDAGPLALELDASLLEHHDDEGVVAPVMPARDVLVVALDIAAGAAELASTPARPEDATPPTTPPRTKKPAPRPATKQRPKEPDAPVESLDVFGPPPAEKPAPVTPAQLRAQANQAFLAGDYDTCIAKCKEALAGGESSCHALLANAYRQIGNADAACRHYKAAGIAHKSCITLQSR